MRNDKMIMNGELKNARRRRRDVLEGRLAASLERFGLSGEDTGCSNRLAQLPFGLAAYPTGKETNIPQ
jgi:hypothetical protein